MRGLKSRIVVISALIVGIGTAGPLSAQPQVPAREGFFIGFGVGGGSLGGRVGGDDLDREVGAAADFKIGGAVNDKILLGVEHSVWLWEDQARGLNATAIFSNLNAVFYGYPDPTQGFFLKGGLGLAVFDFALSSGGFRINPSESDNGVSFTLGSGYDIGFGGRFGLTPHVDYHYARFEEGSVNLIRIGLGFNWY